MSKNTLLRGMVTRDLEDLEKSYKGLLNERVQLERAIEQQIGGITYARMLLKKMDEQEAGEPQEPIGVQGLPEGVEVLGVFECQQANERSEQADDCQCLANTLQEQVAEAENRILNAKGLVQNPKGDASNQEDSLQLLR